jgi:programmed cell death 6-interacting protein
MSIFSVLDHDQECFYHKAVLDKKSASVVARLARQLAVMYAEVERIFASPAMQQHLDKSWLVR